MNILVEYESEPEPQPGPHADIANGLRSAAWQIKRLHQVNCKYKGMWELRTLEEEIDRKRCQITILPDMSVRTYCEDEDLADRVLAILTNIKPD